MEAKDAGNPVGFMGPHLLHIWQVYFHRDEKGVAWKDENWNWHHE